MDLSEDLRIHSAIRPEMVDDANHASNRQARGMPWYGEVGTCLFVEGAGVQGQEREEEDEIGIKAEIGCSEDLIHGSHVLIVLDHRLQCGPHPLGPWRMIFEHLREPRPSRADST